MSVINVNSRSVSDTAQLAALLAQSVDMGDCLALAGEVGAGKTTFAQAFLKPLLQKDEPVTSPTFTLVQWYETKRPWRICHADLYRLRNDSELAELGLEEAFEHHVTLIEWPEIALPLLPDDTLHIRFEHCGEHERSIQLTSRSELWHQRLRGKVA